MDPMGLGVVFTWAVRIVRTVMSISILDDHFPILNDEQRIATS